MKVAKHFATEAYGRSYALFEARGKNLSIYEIFKASGVAQDEFQTKRIQKPENYRGAQTPSGLIIREALGEYVHFEDTPIGKPEASINMMARNLFQGGRTETRHIFETLDEAEGIAHAIMSAAGKNIPIIHEFLPDRVGVPALLQRGHSLYGFVRDVTSKPLRITEYKVDEVTFMSANQFQDLWIAATPVEAEAPELTESFRSVNGGGRWRPTFNDAEVTGYFTQHAAERGARAFARHIQKNIGSFLPT